MREKRFAAANALGRQSLSKVRKGLQDPRRGWNYVRESIVGRARIRLDGNHQAPTQPSILTDEWETLVILDACRYDSLRDRNPFDAECRKRISQAPNTEPWFIKNFALADEELLEDVIYISGNPKASSQNIDPDRLFRLEEVFNRQWDAEHGTVPPDTVTETALNIHSQFPDKRLVVHYIQPHGPFYGADRPDLFQRRYQPLREGSVTVDEVRRAYHQCLDYVLSDVERLVAHLSGDVVVTADHGEAFGESGVYGHPPWAYMRQLLEVPWIRTTGAGEPYQESETDRSTSPTPSVEEQLRDLGYT